MRRALSSVRRLLLASWLRASPSGSAAAGPMSIADGVTRKVTQEFQYTVSSDNQILTFSWLKGSEGRLVVYWVLVYEKK